METQPTDQLSPKEMLETDLSELDNLLAESVALKAPNRRVYKKLKKDVDGLIEEFAARPVWEVLDYITVWTMTKCKCGNLGPIIYLRSMRQSQQVQTKSIHWETIPAIPEGEGSRATLITREVEGCEWCMEVDYLKFEDFTEVTG